MLRKILALFGIAFSASAQTITPDSAGWFTVASAPTYYAQSVNAVIPAGATYRFWGTTPAGVTTYCDSVAVTADTTVRVWGNPGCTVAGKPVPDIAPFGNHSLQFKEQATAITVLVGTTPVTVPASGAIPVIPPVTPPVVPPTGPNTYTVNCTGTGTVDLTTGNMTITDAVCTAVQQPQPKTVVSEGLKMDKTLFGQQEDANFIAEPTRVPCPKGTEERVTACYAD
jgi:hypothetical protein